MSRHVFDYLAARLPRFMVPRYIEIAAALPRNAVGRVTKSDLRSAGVTDATWDRRRDQKPTRSRGAEV